MTARRSKIVNVFSDGTLDGNPVAVVLDADGLEPDDMLAFTRWTNLSEATFVLPPTVADADYRVRIFTLERELPFAGHPTLGTCHAWLEAGGTPTMDRVAVQECGAGLVPIRVGDGVLSFAAPPLVRHEPVERQDLERFSAALGLSPADIVDSHWVDNGPGWVALVLASADAVLAVTPQPGSGHVDIGIVGPCPPGADAAFEVRAFFTDQLGAIREDPVTGSLNASIAQWFFRTGRASGSYVAAQGRCVGRRGRVHLEHEPDDGDGNVWVGGRTTTVVDGHVMI